MPENYQFRDIPLFDASEQQANQSWLPIEITQLSTGNFQGNLRQIEHQDVSVFFESQNRSIHKRSVMPDNLCTVSFVRATSANFRFSEYSSANNALFFLPSGTAFDLNVPSGTDTVYFRFNQSQLLDKARALNPYRWESTPNKLLMLLAPNRPFLDVFTQYIYSHPAFNDNQACSDIDLSLSTLIMDQVLMALDATSLHDDFAPDLVARRRAKKLVYQAIEYMIGALDRHICPSIVDICIDLKISQRNLQYSFKKILDLTPNSYLYHLRLNRVRSQLLKPDHASVTVTQIASYWHFWHLGRFSKDYQQLFGELPSTTLKQSLNS